MSSIRDRLWRRLADNAGLAPPFDRQLMYEAKEELEKQAAEIERLRGDAASLAVAREQLLVQADEIKRLLRSHYEIERLRALAIRAWHSFRSGLTATGGCRDGLADADILELVRLANEHPPA